MVFLFINIFLRLSFFFFFAFGLLIHVVVIVVVVMLLLFFFFVVVFYQVGKFVFYKRVVVLSRFQKSKYLTLWNSFICHVNDSFPCDFWPGIF